MCLYVDNKRTIKYKKRNARILCYKVVRVVDGELHSPFQRNLIEIDPDTLEFSTESSLNATIMRRGFLLDYVDQGIHVYVSKKVAYNALPQFYNSIVVRCWIYPDDIIAVGDLDDCDIAAKRIFFHPDDVEV